jgi:tRNA pseudouridine38-40 synthase
MSEASGQPSRRIALLLEYEGTRYAGSQLQANAPTVQGEVEAAVTKTTGVEARCAFAGRKVAAFSTASGLPADTIRNALNAWLPEDIAVRAAAEVDAGFDPRRNALRRAYRYTILNRRARPALDRRFVWHVPQALGVEAMARAARSLEGERDFAAFASASEDRGSSTVRRLECFRVHREGERVLCDAVANAFLPHQVRRMVGALVEVGLGRLTPGDYLALLEGAPSSAGPAAPARGLTLLWVEYAWPLFGEEAPEGKDQPAGRPGPA